MRLNSLEYIAGERFTYGDPVNVISDASRSIVGNHSLWRYEYANGKWEYVPEYMVSQCSANNGGDPASGCETVINPYTPDLLCTVHRVAYAQMTSE